MIEISLLFGDHVSKYLTNCLSIFLGKINILERVFLKAFPLMLWFFEKYWKKNDDKNRICISFHFFFMRSDEITCNEYLDIEFKFRLKNCSEKYIKEKKNNWRFKWYYKINFIKCKINVIWFFLTQDSFLFNYNRVIE